jgi:hypothetical protein
MDALEIARRRLQTNQGLAPFVLTERWADRRVEQFREVEAARARFTELVRSGADNDCCALTYVGYDDLGQRTIVIELGRPRDKETVTFAQTVRAEQDRSEDVKLIGGLSWTGRGVSLN